MPSCSPGTASATADAIAMAPPHAASARLAGAQSTPASSGGLLGRPSRWLHAYDDFITKNLGQVSQIESTLRSLTYIIPGRFRDAEIASEAIHSGVQLLSLYHDLLLLRAPAPPSQPSLSSSLSSSPSPKPPPEPLHAPSQHGRYTRFWTQKSPFYRRVAIVLQIVRYTELLCEMAAKRRGERLRWRVVVLIEAIKAICRLLLLRVTRGRTLVAPALPVRQPLPEPEEDDEEMVDEEEAEERQIQEQQASQEASEKAEKAAQKTSLSPQPPLSPPPSPTPSKSAAAVTPTFGPVPMMAPPSPAPTVHQTSSQRKGWAMPRTGMSLPPLPQPGDISSYLLTRVLTADDIKPATKLLNQLRGSAHAAEILHILAPLVYAVAMARSKNRRTAWTPWLAGLAVECVARQLRDHNSLRTTTLEREEWNRRGWAMGWWSMRGAFHERVMKGAVAGVRSRMPSFIGGIIEDYEYLWENYYFSTSP